jgi:hypothetical protein
MRVAVFSLRFEDDDAGFDDAPLQEFCATHRVVDVAHHLVQREVDLWLVAIVSWRETTGDRASAARKRVAHSSTDRAGRALASPADPDAAARYDALRNWRNQHARQSGKPPYVIFTNRQASQIAELVPKTLSALASIEGIGPSRIEAWGAEVIELIAGLDTPRPLADFEQPHSESGAGVTEQQSEVEPVTTPGSPGV